MKKYLLIVSTAVQDDNEPITVYSKPLKYVDTIEEGIDYARDDLRVEAFDSAGYIYDPETEEEDFNSYADNYLERTYVYDKLTDDFFVNDEIPSQVILEHFYEGDNWEVNHTYLLAKIS